MASVPTFVVSLWYTISASATSLQHAARMLAGRQAINTPSADPQIEMDSDVDVNALLEKVDQWHLTEATATQRSYVNDYDIPVPSIEDDDPNDPLRISEDYNASHAVEITEEIFHNEHAKADEVDWTALRELKLRVQLEHAPRMRSEGLADDTIELYMLLERKNLEKLFPSRWPRELDEVSHNKHAGDEAWLGAKGGPAYHAEKAFSDLLKMACRARCVLQNPHCRTNRYEQIVKQCVSDYITWSYRDGRLRQVMALRKLPPLLSIIAGQRDTPTELLLVNRILPKLRQRAQSLLTALRKPNALPSELWSPNAYVVPPPSVYAIVILKELVAIVAYEPLSNKDEVRLITELSYQDQLVWNDNAIAIALTAVYCRNHLVRIRQALDLKDEVLPFDDPDL